jgi:hypothetical protein
MPKSGLRSCRSTPMRSRSSFLRSTYCISAWRGALR